MEEEDEPVPQKLFINEAFLHSQILESKDPETSEIEQKEDDEQCFQHSSVGIKSEDQSLYNDLSSPTCEEILEMTRDEKETILTNYSNQTTHNVNIVTDMGLIGSNQIDSLETIDCSHVKVENDKDDGFESNIPYSIKSEKDSNQETSTNCYCYEIERENDEKVDIPFVNAYPTTTTSVGGSCSECFARKQENFKNCEIPSGPNRGEATEIKLESDSDTTDTETQMDDPLTVYGCPITECNFLTSSNLEILIHFKSCHENNLLYMCNRCKQCTYKLNRMTQHFERDHSTDGTNLQKFSLYAGYYLNVEKLRSCLLKFRVYCMLCDFKSKRVDRFNDHYKEKHDDCILNGTDIGVDEANLEETLCVPRSKDESVSSSNANGCDSEADLNESSNVQTGEDEKTVNSKVNGTPSRKQYQCKICNKMVLRLSTHMKVHSSDYFSCDCCDYKTHYAKDLKRHKESHHTMTVSRPSCDHHCEYCDYKTIWKTDLMNHTKMVHYRVKNFECEICHNVFGYSSDLTKHMKIHLEEKNFKCAICGRMFRLKHHLKRHVETVHHQPDYSKVLGFCSLGYKS